MPTPACTARPVRRRPCPVLHTRLPASSWEARESSIALRDPLLDWLALTHIDGLGPMRLAKLLERFGCPSGVFAASPAQVRALALGEPVQDALVRGPDHPWALDQIRAAEDFGASILCLDDPLYPSALRNIPLAPPVLWVTGTIPLEQSRAVAVVGTRAPSGLGSETCSLLVREWAQTGVCVVSGLARGIDEIAHRTCLDQGAPTIAVLGCGLDQIEQSGRRHLARRVSQAGAVVSEFPFGGPVVKGNFPRRNRIISGLSQAVVVVEAGETSGALITARNGLEQGREVLACPGPVGWNTFEGNHRLLREGAAVCARSQDLLDQLGWHTSRHPPTPDGFLDFLAGPGATPEEIAAKMGQRVQDITMQLVLREVAGDVVRGVDGRWRRAL